MVLRPAGCTLTGRNNKTLRVGARSTPTPRKSGRYAYLLPALSLQYLIFSHQAIQAQKILTAVGRNLKFINWRLALLLHTRNTTRPPLDARVAHVHTHTPVHPPAPLCVRRPPCARTMGDAKADAPVTPTPSPIALLDKPAWVHHGEGA